MASKIYFKKMDKNGRICIPKYFRSTMNINPYNMLRLELYNNTIIIDKKINYVVNQKKLDSILNKLSICVYIIYEKTILYSKKNKLDENQIFSSYIYKCCNNILFVIIGNFEKTTFMDISKKIYSCINFVDN